MVKIEEIEGHIYRVWNPAGTFKYIVTGAAISADRILNLPLLTGTDTVAVTDLAQTFLNKTLTTPTINGEKDAQVSKTGNYTLTATDNVIRADASGGAFTLTLPTASGIAGTIYTIIRTDILASTNLLTIDANSTETIDGMLTWKMIPGEKIVIQSDGTNWITLYHDNPSTWGYFHLKNSTNNRRQIAGWHGSAGVILTTTTSPAANTLWALPLIVSKVTRFDTITFHITTSQASQNARAGIYADNGNLYPGALIFDTGSISTGTTGAKDTTITSSLQILQPGIYWLAWETSATTIQIRGLNGSAGVFGILENDSTLSLTNSGFGYSVAHTFGALPDPYTGSATILTTPPSASVPIPAIGVRPI